ncbi:MAG: hypothetical protein LLG04_14080 [Parachlamydia sp.]|nr:hypothetical protein [Parachlamydia sp.]
MMRILTFHYNKPEFIEMQCKTLKAFLVEDFELIVFNDARNCEHEKAIQRMCEKYNIKCIRFEPHWHLTDPLNVYVKYLLDVSEISSIPVAKGSSIKEISEAPSIRHCHVIQYALDNYGYNHDDIVVVMDGDAFFIRPLSIRKLLHNRDIVGIQKSRIEHYLWVVFTAFDPKKLPNPRELKFHTDIINGTLHDSGSHTYHYIKNNPKRKIKKYLGHSNTSRLYLLTAYYGFTRDEKWLINNLSKQHFEFHLEKRLLHFAGSSFDREGAMLKSTCVTQFIDKILSKKL